MIQTNCFRRGEVRGGRELCERQPLQRKRRQQGNPSAGLGNPGGNNKVALGAGNKRRLFNWANTKQTFSDDVRGFEGIIARGNRGKEFVGHGGL